MKKKLIIFIPSIEDGGVEKNLFEVSNYLSKKNISLEIITCNKNMSSNFSKDIKFIGPTSAFWQNKQRSIKYIVCLLSLFLCLIKRSNAYVYHPTPKRYFWPVPSRDRPHHIATNIRAATVDGRNSN